VSAVELIREEPPPCLGRGGYSPLNDWLHTLRQHPEEWFRYPEPLNASASTTIRQGQRAGIARGEYQVVAQRAEGTTKRTMWVRFVGSAELRAVPHQAEQVPA
jgi:hypothetical protein